MSSAHALPTIIGTTENSLRALLARVLTSTAIPGYRVWVALNAASRVDPAVPGGSWRLSVADALKIGPDELDDLVGDLEAAGLLDRDGALTDAGEAELGAARGAVSRATSGLLDGVDGGDLEATIRVLDAVRTRADAAVRL